MLRNKEHFFHALTQWTGTDERSVCKALSPEIRVFVNIRAGDFFAVEHAGVEDSGCGDCGKAF
jgi:hypothetical protein